MADTNVPVPLLPAHIEATIRSIARLHAEHHQNATPLQRADQTFDLAARHAGERAKINSNTDRDGTSAPRFRFKFDTAHEDPQSPCLRRSRWSCLDPK